MNTPSRITRMLMLFALAAPLHGQSSEAAYGGIDGPTLSRIRADFYGASESMEATLASIAYMESRFQGSIQSWPPIARAYRASLEGLIGKHDWRLSEKFGRVNAALALYKNLAEEQPSSLEIRFMRYALYSQLPGLFGVGKQVKPDLEALFLIFERTGDERVPLGQQLDMLAWLRRDGGLSGAELKRLDAAELAVRSRAP
jgi:hypothetical protein